MEQDRNPEINPRIYNQLVSNNSDKNMQQGNNSVLINVSVEEAISICRRMKWFLILHPMRKSTQSGLETEK